MKITNRLYTYPILAKDKNDYETSIFDSSYTYKMSDVNTLEFSFNLLTDNKELLQLINNNKAKYAIHLECSKCGYRKLVTSSLGDFKYKIPINDLNGKLEIVSFIVTTNKINNFSSDDWDRDYDGIELEFEKGTILAYETLNSLDIQKDKFEFKNADSIFKVQHIVTEDYQPMQIELNPDKICIKLCTKDFNTYVKFANKKTYNPLIHAIFIFPALIYVFEELKQQNDDESGVELHKTKRWFIALNNSYKDRGIDFVNEICNEDKTSIQLAQEALDNVISKALNTMIELYGDCEEEE